MIKKETDIMYISYKNIFQSGRYEWDWVQKNIREISNLWTKVKGF